MQFQSTALTGWSARRGAGLRRSPAALTKAAASGSANWPVRAGATGWNPLLASKGPAPCPRRNSAFCTSPATAISRRCCFFCSCLLPRSTPPTPGRVSVLSHRTPYYCNPLYPGTLAALLHIPGTPKLSCCPRAVCAVSSKLLEPRYTPAPHHTRCLRSVRCLIASPCAAHSPRLPSQLSSYWAPSSLSPIHTHLHSTQHLTAPCHDRLAPSMPALTTHAFLSTHCAFIPPAPHCDHCDHVGRCQCRPLRSVRRP